MKIKKSHLRNLIKEAITVDIAPGDVILTGKFKNKRTIVKEVGTDQYGHPTINGKSILKFKVEKFLPKEDWSSKSKKGLESQMSEGICHHIDSGVGIDRNIFRPGSEEFFALFREARKLWSEGRYFLANDDEIELIQCSDIGEFGMYEGQRVPLDYPMLEGSLNEAEYQGKKVELNKPKRGGDGAYVYVNSGKKDKDGKVKVKKVSFGSSMPDAMGDSEAHRKRRKSYGDRHNCSDKDDKTTAGYWSCRATKFFGRDISGWW